MTADTTPNDTEAETLAKRERVRRFLIAPLERDGMVRGKRVKLTEHEAFLAKLADRLGYMAPDNLERLRQVCMAHALGEARNVWPGWVTIRAFAYRLQTPPDPENPIKQSWLHSRRGPQLRAHGGLVETYLFLDKENRPPSEVEERRIADEARENARKRQRVVEAIERGTALEDDRRWLAWYDQLADRCNDIVDAGIAHRDGKGEAA